MKLLVVSVLFLAGFLNAKQVAYIYGDVSADGDVPSGGEAPYDQMLLNDPGNTGLTSFKALVESQGYSIFDHYDAHTTLTEEFLRGYDVIIFGLHQKMWTKTEKNRLRAWIDAGGGMMIYSDSASGGRFNIVGINNPVGRDVTNNLIAEYGMEVTVDLGGGTRSYQAGAGLSHPIVWDQPVFEGEGVSPVAVDPRGEARVLIPLQAANRVSGGGNLNPGDELTNIENPEWAAMAHREFGEGNLIVIFDRQPIWNNGPGSDIDRRDNREILRRTVRFLARDYGNSTEWFQFQKAGERLPFKVSWRQWKGGNGALGTSYNARNIQFALQTSKSLLPESWENGLVQVSEAQPPLDFDAESEIVTVEVAPVNKGQDSLFVRLATLPLAGGAGDIVVDAGQDRLISLNGRVGLEPNISGGGEELAFSWTKVSGPGEVTFSSANEAETTASFDRAGTYLLKIEASDGIAIESDQIVISVVEPSDIVHAINCGKGSGTVIGLNGIRYLSDRFYNPSGSWTDNFPGNAVAGTEDDNLYNDARSNFSYYDLPVVHGDYTVYLQFSETFFDEANKRVFEISIEGDLVIDDLDLAAISPGKWVSYDRMFSTTVNDGVLRIGASSSVNHSLLNAIVVVEE
ncbi:MAG: malectin domain-containing carbohydrate-binding protein [Akkermansiaceae bacterium]